MTIPENRAEKEYLRDNIKRRLRRIEGQLKGIQRMLDEDTCCTDILVQISAVRAATAKVGVMIIENHVQECLAKALQGEDMDREAALKDMVRVMNDFIK